MLKGNRCESAKCPMEKQDRNKPPGTQSWRRGRVSEYGVRLREKQKVKRYYGVLERQFRGYFERAVRSRTNTGEVLLTLLERRLDNVLHKMNFAISRRAARQIIAHGDVLVNGRKVDIASYLVKQGEKITLKPSGNVAKAIKENLQADSGPPVQEWLQVNPAIPEGVVVALPSRDHVQIPVEEQLIVELCSR